MRWDELFADLEAQAALAEAAETSAEVEERTRMLVGQIRLLERLKPAVGSAVRLRCLGGLELFGALTEVAGEWLLIDEGAGREALVVMPSLLTVSGLRRLSAVPSNGSNLERRLGLRHALRGIVRDRLPLRIHLVDGSVVDGTLDRVGQDFAELAAHAAGEMRRRADVREVLTVPLRALVAIRRDG